MNMSFESEVLNSHDFVKANSQQPEDITQVYQDDYDDGIQSLGIFYQGGLVRHQKRQWSPEDHDEFYRLADNGGFQTPQERWAFIESHSKLMEEHLDEVPKTVDQAEATVAELKTSLEDYLNLLNLRADEHGKLHSTISLEAIHTLSMELAIADVSPRQLMIGLSGKVRGLLHGFSGYLKSRQIHNLYNYEAGRIRKVADKVKDVPFSSLASRKFPAMRGQKGRYLKVLEALCLAQDAAETTYKDTLVSLRQWLAKLSNSQDLRHSVQDLSGVRSNIGTGETSIYHPVREALNAVIENRPEIDHPYGMLFSNHQEWSEIERIVPTLLGRIDRQGPAAFNDALTSCVHLIDHLVSIIDREQDKAVSQEVAAKLGAIVYKVAQEVEFVAAYNVLVTQFCTAIGETAEAVLKNR